MSLKKYERLKEQYPEQISLDQLYRICRISKRSALYLVQHDIIPSIDTGKKTWRYRIALDDVITYLRRREQVGSMIPVGAVTSPRRSTGKPYKSFSDYINPDERTIISEYFNYIFADYPDVITLADIVEMTGLAKETLRKLVCKGKLKTLGFINGKHVVPKQYLLEFVNSDVYMDVKSNSASFKKVLGGFELWKAAR